MFRWTVYVVGFVTLAAASGCGGYTPIEGVIVTGKIVQGGQPIPVAPTPEGDGVEVQIMAASPDDLNLATTGASCDASGHFEITHEGMGVPPGKYKLAVFVRQGDSSGSSANKPDKLEGKLSPGNTTIEIEVPQEKLGDEHDLGTIDIATYLK